MVLFSFSGTKEASALKRNCIDYDNVSN